MNNSCIHRRASVLAMILLCLASQSHAEEMYASQHALLIAAIRVGQAKGILGGPAAELFRTRFGGATPLHVEAKVTADYTKPDCKRIAVVYRHVAGSGESTQGEVLLRLEFNYCLDGPPPAQLEVP